MQPCDLRYMAKCCQNLAHFGAESVAVKSYIAMMPLFSRSDALHTPLPWTTGGNIEARTYSLQQARTDSSLPCIPAETSGTTWHVRVSCQAQALTLLLLLFDSLV